MRAFLALLFSLMAAHTSFANSNNRQHLQVLEFEILFEDIDDYDYSFRKNESFQQIIKDFVQNIDYLKKNCLDISPPMTTSSNVYSYRFLILTKAINGLKNTRINFEKALAEKFNFDGMNITVKQSNERETIWDGQFKILTDRKKHQGKFAKISYDIPVLSESCNTGPVRGWRNYKMTSEAKKLLQDHLDLPLDETDIDYQIMSSNLEEIIWSKGFSYY